MFLFDEVLLAHALNRVVLVILLVLAKHHLAKGAPAEHLQQLKFLKIADIVHVGLVLENQLALRLHLLVLLDRLRIQVERVDRVHLFLVFIHIVDGGCVLLQREVVVVVQRHLFFVEAAVALDQRFHDLQFQVRRRKPVIVLFFNMDHKLAAEATDRHRDHVRIGYSPLDPAEQPHEGLAGKYVVEIFIGEQQNALLLLVDMVDLHQLCRKDYCLYVKGERYRRARAPWPIFYPPPASAHLACSSIMYEIYIFIPVTQIRSCI